MAERDDGTGAVPPPPLLLLLLLLMLLRLLLLLLLYIRLLYLSANSLVRSCTFF